MLRSLSVEAFFADSAAARYSASGSSAVSTSSSPRRCTLSGEKSAEGTRSFFFAAGDLLCALRG